MPYRSYPKRRFKKKAKPALSKREKKDVKKIVKKEINNVVETKQAAYKITNQVISSASGNKYIVNAANGLSDGVTRTPGQQGVGGYQHIGNELLIKMAEFRCSFYSNANTQVANSVRIMVVWDKKAQGLLVATNELLYDAGSGNSYLSPLKYNSHPTYKVLYDQTVTLMPSGTINEEAAEGAWLQAQYRYNFHWKKYFPKGLKTTYYPDTSATDTTTIQDNALYVLLIANTENVRVENGYMNMLYQDA
ncbi:MAG: capsid protein [Cressdnaviricota sp.]|nr:MAG: capsid protein [Cressdnaviricota sp.]